MSNLPLLTIGNYYYHSYNKIVKEKIETGQGYGTRHSLVTLFFLSVSVKDQLLHWVLGKSQTYYPEHILVYGSREGSLLSCCGF